MRSGTAGVSAAGRGRSGSSGITMPSPMNIPSAAPITRRKRRSSDSDGVQGSSKTRKLAVVMTLMLRSAQDPACASSACSRSTTASETLL